MNQIKLLLNCVILKSIPGGPGPHSVRVSRSQLEEVRAENGALGQRLGALQQEVSELEDDVAKRT